MTKRIVSLLLVLCMVSVCTMAFAWDCTNCGQRNNSGNFCTNCGMANNTGSDNSGNSNTSGNTNASTSSNSRVRVGDVIQFGRYHQTSSGNDNNKIDWWVLDVQGDMALVLSRYGLAKSTMNNRSDRSYWAQTSLRTWLNGEFLASAFVSSERDAIQLTAVDNGPSQQDSAKNTSRMYGETTYDYVFLLSYAEAVQYLSNMNMRKCVPTSWARARGCNYSRSVSLEGHATCWWWLRDPVYNNNFSVVDDNGSIETCYMSHTYGVVRPAMWVSLSALGY